MELSTQEDVISAFDRLHAISRMLPVPPDQQKQTLEAYFRLTRKGTTKEVFDEAVWRFAVEVLMEEDLRDTALIIKAATILSDVGLMMGFSMGPRDIVYEVLRNLVYATDHETREWAVQTMDLLDSGRVRADSVRAHITPDTIARMVAELDQEAEDALARMGMEEVA